MKRRMLILVLIAHAPLYAGKLYRWIDAGGQVHFSDQRPVGDHYEIRLLSGSQKMNTSKSGNGIRPGESDWLKQASQREATRQSSRKAASRAYAAKSEHCIKARERYNATLHDSIAGGEGERKRAKDSYAAMRADCR